MEKIIKNNDELKKLMKKFNNDDVKIIMVNG
jgi:vacuolar-type H+-ATPase subunit F/Vma7